MKISIWSSMTNHTGNRNLIFNVRKLENEMS